MTAVASDRKISYAGRMTSIMIELSADEATRLAAIAAHEGETPDALAARAVRECIAEDKDWEEGVNAAIADAERGDVLTLEEFDVHITSVLANIERKQ